MPIAGASAAAAATSASAAADDAPLPLPPVCVLTAAAAKAATAGATSSGVSSASLCAPRRGLTHLAAAAVSASAAPAAALRVLDLSRNRLGAFLPPSVSSAARTADPGAVAAGEAEAAAAGAVAVGSAGFLAALPAQRAFSALRVLDLAHNALPSLAWLSPATVGAGLQQLLVQGNALASLPPLGSFGQLAVLNASNNAIALLGDAVGTPGLEGDDGDVAAVSRTLRAASGTLSAASSASARPKYAALSAAAMAARAPALALPPGLTSLDLSHNRLHWSAVAAAGVPALRALEKLSLSHNPLFTANATAEATVASSRTAGSVVPASSSSVNLSALRVLEELDLAATGLATVPVLPSSLVSLALSDNPHLGAPVACAATATTVGTSAAAAAAATSAAAASKGLAALAPPHAHLPALSELFLAGTGFCALGTVKLGGLPAAAAAPAAGTNAAAAAHSASKTATGKLGATGPVSAKKAAAAPTGAAAAAPEAPTCAWPALEVVDLSLTQLPALGAALQFLALHAPALA